MLKIILEIWGLQKFDLKWNLDLQSNIVFPNFKTYVIKWYKENFI